MTVNYYSYKELEAAALADASEENLAALGEWFERFGSMFSNGECYKVNADHDLYPVYEDHFDEDGEFDYAEIVGWELR